MNRLEPGEFVNAMLATKEDSRKALLGYITARNESLARDSKSSGVVEPKHIESLRVLHKKLLPGTDVPSDAMLFLAVVDFEFLANKDDL
ncbi:MAG: hypothetical protein LBG64_03920 [Pseudomonadales bacterium]|nr:hypothetical protein [Pseudomonadales bacterium]